jgi:transposase-like protein
MEKKRNKYPNSFKIQIVRKYLESDKPVSVFAESIGLEQSILNRWVKRYRTGFDNEAQRGTENLTERVKSLENELSEAKETIKLLQGVVKKISAERYE